MKRAWLVFLTVRRITGFSLLTEMKIHTLWKTSADLFTFHRLQRSWKWQVAFPKLSKTFTDQRHSACEPPRWLGLIRVELGLGVHVWGGGGVEMGWGVGEIGEMVRRTVVSWKLPEKRNKTGKGINSRDTLEIWGSSSSVSVSLFKPAHNSSQRAYPRSCCTASSCLREQKQQHSQWWLTTLTAHAQ